MTIGFNKMSELVEEEVSKLVSGDTERGRVLSDLCKKLYMLESNSKRGVSAQRVMDEMSQEISNVADKLAQD